MVADEKSVAEAAAFILRRTVACAQCSRDTGRSDVRTMSTELFYKTAERHYRGEDIFSLAPRIFPPSKHLFFICVYAVGNQLLKTAVERSLKIQTMTTREVYLANHTCATLCDDISASRNFSL